MKLGAEQQAVIADEDVARRVVERTAVQRGNVKRHLHLMCIERIPIRTDRILESVAEEPTYLGIPQVEVQPLRDHKPPTLNVISALHEVSVRHWTVSFDLLDPTKEDFRVDAPAGPFDGRIDSIEENIAP